MTVLRVNRQISLGLMAVALAAAGCSRVSESFEGRPSEAVPEPAPTRAALQAPAPKNKVVWKTLAASNGDVTKAIAEETAVAKAQGRSVLVYVGATWCEPCQHFHHAIEAGKFDAVFGDVTFLAFDIDESRSALFAADYRSTYIPLFAVPDANGRATHRRSEGGIKGEGAADDLAQKLKTLLGKS